MNMFEGKPKIALVIPNTFTSIGLRGIIEKMMPGADICIFDSYKELEKFDQRLFFHFFISARILMENASFFIKNQRKTIVLVHGEEKGHIPQQFHTINVYQTEECLIKEILKLAEHAHNTNHPDVVERAKCQDSASPLTFREIEVLRLVVTGFINKEIAEKLNVSLATIVSHRKNITEKLNIKSVSGLTIYAVTHGFIQAEEI